MVKSDLTEIGLIFLFGAVPFAWVVMLVIGVAYHELGVFRPVGYWPTLGVSLLIGLVGVSFELRLRYMDRTGSRF